jgi:hypothetical protein
VKRRIDFGGAGEVLSHGGVESSAFHGVAQSIWIEREAPDNLPQQQRRERNHQHYLYGDSAKAEDHLRHPYDDEQLKECPEHQCASLMRSSGLCRLSITASKPLPAITQLPPGFATMRVYTISFGAGPGLFTIGHSFHANPIPGWMTDAQA